MQYFKGLGQDHLPDSLLQHCGDADLMLAGTMLSDLRSDRNDADYQLKDPAPEQEVNAALRLHSARRIIGILNTCLAGKGNADSRFEKAIPAAKARAEFLRSGPPSS